MSEYPAGNQIKCRFAFTTRPLIKTEQVAFLSGNGLPAGVGIAQTIVLMDWAIDDGPTTTLASTAITNPISVDEPGGYSTIITTPPCDVPATLIYHGYSQDSLGNPIAATEPGTITVKPWRQLGHA